MSYVLSEGGGRTILNKQKVRIKPNLGRLVSL